VGDDDILVLLNNNNIIIFNKHGRLVKQVDKEIIEELNIYKLQEISTDSVPNFEKFELISIQKLAKDHKTSLLYHLS